MISSFLYRSISCSVLFVKEHSAYWPIRSAFSCFRLFSRLCLLLLHLHLYHPVGSCSFSSTDRREFVFAWLYSVKVIVQERETGQTPSFPDLASTLYCPRHLLFAHSLLRTQNSRALLISLAFVLCAPSPLFPRLLISSTLSTLYAEQPLLLSRLFRFFFFHSLSPHIDLLLATLILDLLVTSGLPLFTGAIISELRAVVISPCLSSAPTASPISSFSHTLRVHHHLYTTDFIHPTRRRYHATAVLPPPVSSTVVSVLLSCLHQKGKTAAVTSVCCICCFLLVVSILVFCRLLLSPSFPSTTTKQTQG